VNCEFENSLERMRPWAIFRCGPVVCVTAQAATVVVPIQDRMFYCLSGLLDTLVIGHIPFLPFFYLCCVRLSCVGRGLQWTDPLSEKPRAVSKDSAVHD
jgi:hypothetical protein